jgi:hypothetical protein
MKVCSKCKRELSFSEFHIDSYSSTGYSSQCKACKRGDIIDNVDWKTLQEEYLTKTKIKKYNNKGELE